MRNIEENIGLAATGIFVAGAIGGVIFPEYFKEIVGNAQNYLDTTQYLTNETKEVLQLASNQFKEVFNHAASLEFSQRFIKTPEYELSPAWYSATLGISTVSPVAFPLAITASAIRLAKTGVECVKNYKEKIFSFPSYPRI